MKRTLTCLGIAVSSVFLVACNSDDGDDVAPPPPAPPPASNTVPASATASPAAYSQYAGSLMNSETAEELDVQGVEPPTSETEEPIVAT